ncbi:hypothetical protein PSYCG_07965 [Psychrobacter sp. G]|nr:hypothetical protein PSYCG_07965 [Psychrobacter sp. G]
MLFCNIAQPVFVMCCDKMQLNFFENYWLWNSADLMNNTLMENTLIKIAFIKFF